MYKTLHLAVHLQLFVAQKLQPETKKIKGRKYKMRVQQGCHHSLVTLSAKGDHW